MQPCRLTYRVSSALGDTLRQALIFPLKSEKTMLQWPIILSIVTLCPKPTKCASKCPSIEYDICETDVMDDSPAGLIHRAGITVVLHDSCQTAHRCSVVLLWSDCCGTHSPWEGGRDARNCTAHHHGSRNLYTTCLSYVLACSTIL